jgi:hypothetical protein
MVVGVPACSAGFAGLLSGSGSLPRGSRVLGRGFCLAWLLVGAEGLYRRACARWILRRLG